MIVIQRKLRGLLPYRLIYWPTETVLKELAENLTPTHYARVESASLDLERGRCVISHHPALTLLIDLRRPLGAIYKDLIDNARIRVHKAEKLGNRLALRHYGGGPDKDRLLPEFAELYNDFIRGKGLLAANISTAREYSLFPNADLIMAYLDGEPICGHLNLVDREASIARLLYSGNKRFHDSATARLAGIVNVYLHWHELERYREQGLSTYDFGSLGHVEDSVGVNRFKMQFGGTIIREYNYLLAGIPAAWRTVFRLMSLLGGHWERRQRVQRAGERWRDMPLDLIRQTIETSIENYQRSTQVRRGADSPVLAPDVRETHSVGALHKHGKPSQHP